MSSGNSLINLGDLSKPANTLVERVSDAIGGIAGPWQTRRMAKAEADAELIKAESRIKISEIEERALGRMIKEEGQKQENIENITSKAIPKLSDSANPENIEKDWLTHFFDKSRLTSNEEMQTLWGNILAGEANKPSSFSKRSIDLVATLERRDAELFTKFCTFCWMIGDLTALVFDSQAEIYNKNGINFSSLTHLDDIGLIKFNYASAFKRQNLPKYWSVFYYGRPTIIEFQNDENNLDIGKVILTQAGKELAAICGSERSEGFYDYVIERWFRKGYILSSPYKKRAS